MSDPSTLKDIFQIGSYVLPLAVIVFQAGVHRQRIKTLENQFKAFMAHCASCKSGLDKDDDELHSRVTALVDRIARIEGQMNGHKKGSHRAPT